MAESIPKFKPQNSPTCHAGAAITGARFVSISAAPTEGNTTVQHTGAAAKAFGVSATDAASGAKLTVWRGGVVPVEAGTGGVTAGQVVEAEAAGKAITRSAGIACGTVVEGAAAGAQALIALDPALL